MKELRKEITPYTDQYLFFHTSQKPPSYHLLVQSQQ